MRETVIVTGGAGFVGSHVADAFIAAGYEVAVIDDLSNGRLENIPRQARFYRADIRDAPALERIFARERPAIVSHQAALVDVRQSLSCPETYASVNILGTLGVLEAARKHGARKFIFASTGGAIYGEADQDKKVGGQRLLWLAASRSAAAAGELALAEVLDGLLAQPALIAAYRQRAQAHAQAHYSWEQVTDQYEALLKQP